MRMTCWIVMLAMLTGVRVSEAGQCAYSMYPDQEAFSPTVYTTPNSICIYPDGRTSLSQAVRGNMNLYYGLLLEEYDYNSGWHHVAYEEQGIMLGGVASNVVLCDTTTAYILRDWSMPIIGEQTIRGGGHSAVDQGGQPVGGIVCYWAPSEECGVYEMEVYINSPDINGDMVVNLADTILYSGDLNGGYNYRSDFNWDGVINVTDTAIFAAAIGAHCQ